MSVGLVLVRFSEVTVTGHEVVAPAHVALTFAAPPPTPPAVPGRPATLWASSFVQERIKTAADLFITALGWRGIARLSVEKVAALA
jgi:hypothetical protein